MEWIVGIGVAALWLGSAYLSYRVGKAAYLQNGFSEDLAEACARDVAVITFPAGPVGLIAAVACYLGCRYG